MSQPTLLTHDTFWEFVHVHKFAVVHFWAAWNGYDIQMRRLIESQIPNEISEQVSFGTLAVDSIEHHEICRQHNILNLPFLAFYHKGLLIHKVTGLPESNVLIQQLRDLLLSFT